MLLILVTYNIKGVVNTPLVLIVPIRLTSFSVFINHRTYSEFYFRLLKVSG